ncbi:MAG: hypothetical protein JXR58_13155 [Bacteroidales bacterium]|nr:hypothetical protein [Bacteroidales bacterium]
MSQVFLVYGNTKTIMLDVNGYVLERKEYTILLSCKNCKSEVDITKTKENVEYIYMVNSEENKFSLIELRSIAKLFHLEEEYYSKTNKYVFKAVLKNQSPITFVKKVTCPSCGQVHYCCFALTGDHTHSPGQFLHLIGIKTV